MDITKLKTFVDQNIVVDIRQISDNKISVVYRKDNETFEVEFPLYRYPTEEELVAVINTEFDRRIQGKINTAIK